ncbi:MAG: LexA family transcriptional regulator [Marinifilaceae bacterium]|jgi:transcriptional regulator with XRE-family HTH domain|nr:LexA family transcriptional regulator [Marinifilaceae bacterium]
MKNLPKNLKYLRTNSKLSQSRLSGEIGVAASSISSYEKAKSVPKVKTLNKYSDYFEKDIDSIVNKNIELESQLEEQKLKGDKIRILPILVDEKNEEKISLVSEKAAAGYLQGYKDTEYIQSLPNFNMPFMELSENKTYRAFQISGDSMLPVSSGSYIICEYLQDWKLIDNNKCYIVASIENGLVYKRVTKDFDNKQLILKSDNKEYCDFEIAISEINEIWKAIGYVSFQLPE